MDFFCFFLFPWCALYVGNASCGALCIGMPRRSLDLAQEKGHSGRIYLLQGTTCHQRLRTDRKKGSTAMYQPS